MHKHGTVHLLQDFTKLTIVNPPKRLETSVLTITVKSLEPDEKQPWSKKVTRRKMALFEVIKEKDFRTIETDQGFDEIVMKYLAENGYHFHYHDHRGELPHYNMSLTYGMRFSQKAVLEEALRKRRSGLIALPTRYGKSRVALNVVRAFDKVTTAILMPGADLVNQMYEFYREELPNREVKKLSAKTRSADVLIGSVDSAHHCQHGKIKLLILDEPHALVTESRIDKIRAFDRALKLGTGATVTGRFDNKDLLIQGIIGPVLSERTFLEAVDEGAICNIDAVLIVVQPKMTHAFSRDILLDKNLYRNEAVGAAMQIVCETFPRDWQMLGFIKNEKSAEFMIPYMGEYGAIAMAKRMTTKERDKFFGKMASGEIKRCLASDIYSQGVTFSALRSVINLAGGGPYTNSVQRPGRLAEVIEGKETGIMVDFIFEPTDSGMTLYDRTLVNDSRKRYETYIEKGYHVHFVNSRRELREKLNELIIKNGGTPNVG